MPDGKCLFLFYFLLISNALLVGFEPTASPSTHFRERRTYHLSQSSLVANDKSQDADPSEMQQKNPD